MDPRDLAIRLHDILRAAQRIRLPGPGCTASTAVESIDEVKGGLRDLIRDLGAPEPLRHAPRQPATAAAFPASEGDGVRPVVQHRRRVRRTCPDRILVRGWSAPREPPRRLCSLPQSTSPMYGSDRSGAVHFGHPGPSDR